MVIDEVVHCYHQWINLLSAWTFLLFTSVMTVWAMKADLDEDDWQWRLVFFYYTFLTQLKYTNVVGWNWIILHATQSTILLTVLSGDSRKRIETCHWLQTFTQPFFCRTFWRKIGNIVECLSSKLSKKVKWKRIQRDTI